MRSSSYAAWERGGRPLRWMAACCYQTDGQADADRAGGKQDGGIACYRHSRREA